MSAELRLDDQHRYWKDEREYVAVTTALRVIQDHAFSSEEAMYRGSVIHQATRFYDEGDLDESSVDPAVKSYLDAWISFRADTGFTPDLIECRVYDPLRGFAGTLDRAMTDKAWRWIVDIKSGVPADWHGPQLAAYLSLLSDPFTYRRMAVHLSDDGTYKVREYPQKEYVSDLNVFYSCLNIHNWKMRH